MIRVRRLAEVRATADLVWFRPALDRLRSLPRDADARLRTFFSPDAAVYIARAPGRLDVMGGIADYSGATVLELPLARATTVLLQVQDAARCDVVTRREGGWHWFGMDVSLLADGGGAASTPEGLAAWLAGRPDDRWAGYVVGVVQALLQRAARAGRAVPRRLRLLVDSTVPAGRGIASSAALEVATGAAVAAACRDDLPASDLAAACQAVENRVVGAPCGIMDQMTAACGRSDRLLRVRCQPGTIEGHAAIPAGVRVFGIDSGITHAVSGADYGTVRTAAFMGYRMLAAAAGLPAVRDGTRVRIEDRRWHGYLANVSAGELADLGRSLPEEMSGGEFLACYGGITDTATTVIPERHYPVRRATEHPVGEQARVERFARLLETLADRPETAVELGELMYASHASYSACGLGSDGTDRLVEMVAAAGPRGGLFGAKITGGGSGGTVAVLGRSDAADAVREIAVRYQTETGRRAEVFADSGPGAEQTGVLVLTPAEMAVQP
jgi:galactokinase